MTKQCRRCKENKDVNQFSRRNQLQPYLRVYCKNCVALFNRERLVAMREAQGRTAVVRRDAPRELSPGEKWCGGCGTVKSTSEFHTGSTVTRCKSCKAIASRRSTLARHGLTEDDYRSLFERQSGVCAVCKRPEGISDRLCIDHDHSCCPGEHSCGKCVRGLLCRRCNATLGFVDDSVKLLAGLATYLNA